MNISNVFKISFMALFFCIYFSTNAFAEDKLVFQPVQQETEQTRAICYAKRSRSESELTKQSERFRGYLDPHQLQEVISGRQVIEFNRIMSVANVIVMGNQATAEIQEAEIAIEIKSLQQETMSTILFRWSPQDPTRMEQLSDRLDRLSFIDQGLPECMIQGTRFGSERCLFDAQSEAEELLGKHIEHLGDEKQEKSQKSISQGLIIEVIYRSQAYVDCSGRNAQSVVRTYATRPVLSLRKR